MRFDSSLRRAAALVACVVASIFLIVPFWPWIAMAIWTTSFIAPLRRRRIPPIVLTIALVLSFILPVGLALVPLATEANTLVRSLVTAESAPSMLRGLVENGAQGASFEPSLEAIFAQSRLAWSVMHTIGGATTRAAAGFFVFCVIAYTRLQHGEEIYAWFREHAPVNGDVLDRLAAAFIETGRGLFFGIGGAALAQATIATITYRLLGVPHALVLGLLTFVAAIIPGLGSALAWGPIAAGLALTGRPLAAVVMLGVGFFIVGTIDNVLRPWLTRYGKLQMSTPLVFVSMLGGLVVLGPTGILLAPLVVRLTKEMLLIAHEARVRE